MTWKRPDEDRPRHGQLVLMRGPQGGLFLGRFVGDTDTAMALLHSFGNDRMAYLWSPELEAVKRPASLMVSRTMCGSDGT